MPQIAGSQNSADMACYYILAICILLYFILIITM